NGNQLASPDDAITVELVSSGYKVTLNGEVAQFDARDPLSGATPVSSITINTGSGDDTVNIEATSSLRAVTVNLGNGTDTVNLSPAGQNLNNLAGAVTINGGSGTDTLNLFDQGIKTNQNYTVTSSSVARTGPASLTYHNVANVVLDTSNGTNTITVQ